MFKRKKKNGKDVQVVNENTEAVIEEDMNMGDGQEELNINNEEIIIEDEVSHLDESTNTESNNEYILYAIIDKKLPGLLEYMRESGLNVSRIFQNVTDARNTILMQYRPARIIVIETGMGIFTATKVRQEIIDMLSLSDDDSKITVFYTSSVLKMDAVKTIGKTNKNIEWVNFKSVVDVIADVLLYKETYLDDDYVDSVEDVCEERILKHKGALSDNYKDEGERIILHGLSPEMIATNVLEGDESIPKYAPHI